MHSAPPSPSRAALAGDVLLRALVLALIWWVLTDGRMQSWLIGAPVTALALAASLKLVPPPSLRISPLGVLAFFGFFLLQSLKGGTQVALIALRPRLDLHPVELMLPLRLAPGLGQQLLAGTLCLMPGTLAVGIEGNRLCLHVLDRRIPAERELRATEERIAHLIGETLR